MSLWHNAGHRGKDRLASAVDLPPSLCPSVSDTLKKNSKNTIDQPPPPVLDQSQRKQPSERGNPNGEHDMTRSERIEHCKQVLAIRESQLRHMIEQKAQQVNIDKQAKHLAAAKKSLRQAISTKETT